MEWLFWHLIEKLKLETTKIKQIIFHQSDYYLVTHQARRVLEQLFGYERSPFYGEKLKATISRLSTIGFGSLIV
jgi:DNA topoisomerase IA